MTSEHDVLSVLAHELRSPVAALAVLAEAGRSLTGNDERRRAVQLAIAAARDVERLVRDPKLLSLERAAVDLAELVEGLADDRVETRVEARPSVLGDETRLRQVLANLVGNGLRHGTRVEVVLTERDGLALLDVVDDGPGPDAAVDPFARGSSGAGSTGLGLWLARAIAEAHGGTLDVVPPEARGARFRLALPSASAAR